MSVKKSGDKKKVIAKGESASSGKEHEQLEKKSKEYLEGWQRAKADYLNLQKEIVKEKESFARYAKTNYVMQLLPLYNNLQIAFKHLPDELVDNEWVSGVLHIKDQFTDLLKDLNIEKIKTKDKPFDASIHEAVSQEDNDGYKSGTIIREVTPGYLIDGEALIPAKVIIAE